jgi:hypothetical protein
MLRERIDMRSLLTILLISATLGLIAPRVNGAEFDFYERLASLTQTNCFGPDLTNATLSLSRMKQSGEIAGVKPGSGMSEAVQKWGKPRNMYALCGGGPLLMFGHGSLAFKGDKVVRIEIYPSTFPGLRFEGGLTVTNTPAQFAHALGVPEPGPAPWALYVDCPYGVMELRWSHSDVGGWQLSWLSLGPPEPAQTKAR